MKPATDKLAPQTNEPPRPALGSPRFSLASLMIAIGGLGVLFAAMSAVGPLGAFALLMLVLAIIAHVAGNSIGTRLRSFGSTQVDDRCDAAQRQLDRSTYNSPPPASNLSHRTKATKTMIGFTIAGAAIVGSMGSALLIWITWQQLNLATAIVAILSPTVLGGLLGFTVSSFTQTAGGAIWEARNSHQH